MEEGKCLKARLVFKLAFRSTFVQADWFSPVATEAGPQHHEVSPCLAPWEQI